MKSLFITISIFISASVFAQPPSDIAAQIGDLRCASKDIRTEKSIAALMKQGTDLLPVLAGLFTDTSNSAVYSTCAKRYLRHGEIAIIIADGIEGMPYYLLTNLQNCTLESCPDSPNWVEYYLNFIKSRITPKEFQRRYTDWLKSKDRKKYQKG